MEKETSGKEQRERHFRERNIICRGRKSLRIPGNAGNSRAQRQGEEIGLNMMGRRAVAESGRSLDSTLNEM